MPDNTLRNAQAPQVEKQACEATAQKLSGGEAGLLKALFVVTWNRPNLLQQCSLRARLPTTPTTQPTACISASGGDKRISRFRYKLRGLHRTWNSGAKGPKALEFSLSISGRHLLRRPDSSQRQALLPAEGAPNLQTLSSLWRATIIHLQFSTRLVTTTKKLTLRDATVELFGAVARLSSNARCQMHENVFLSVPNSWPRAA